MATNVRTRNSAVADRNGAASKSPFRADKRTTRIAAAHKMIRTRKQEIAAIETMLGRATDKATQRRLTQRLQASTHNLRSWEDYLAAGSLRESRAVIHPHN